MLRYEYSRKDIARSVGRSERTISWWRTSRTQPSIQDLQKIAKLEGLSVTELLDLGKTTHK